MNDKKITLYTKKSCPQCAGVALFLTRRGIKFTAIDVEENSEALEYIKQQGFLSVPITEIEGNFIKGFDVRKLEEI